MYSTRNGCWNREPLKEQLVVQDGWVETMDGMSRTPKMITINDPMTKRCQYTKTELGKADGRCLGCWEKS